MNFYSDKQQRKFLAIIPARGGSKGVKGKNLKLLAGKPLIQHSIEAAQSSELVDDVVVSTDNDAIAATAEKLGAEVVRRPPELAADNSLVIDAIEYTVAFLAEHGRRYDFVTLLEPTSPLRSAGLVDECLCKLLDPGVDSVATFTESVVSPNRLWRVENEKATPYIAGAVPWLPRQQQPVSYELNGLVYGFSVTNLFQSPKRVSFLSDNISVVVTPRENSLDIDTELDFVIAESVMRWRAAK
jgi:CMP-N,N'-diacetyllegionaminic acid synthase